MQTSGPYTLAAPGSSTGQVSDPSQRFGSTSDRVQVQNTSVWALAVYTAGQLLTIQPWTAQTVPVSASGITIDAVYSPASASTPNTVLLCWLLPGEQPAQPDGQLSAQAIAAAITSGSLGVHNDAGTALAGAGWVIPVTTAAGALPWDSGNITPSEFGELIVVDCLGADAAGEVIVAASNSAGALWAGITQPIAAGGNGQWLLPIPVGTSGTIRIIAGVLSGSTTHFAGGIAVTAAAGAAAPNVRADGRPGPFSRFAAQIPIGSTSGTVIAAPPSLVVGALTVPTRLLISQLVGPIGEQSAGTVLGQAYGTVNGQQVPLIGWGWGTTPQTPIAINPNEGQLLDPSTGISLMQTSAPFSGFSGTVIYDIVT